MEHKSVALDLWRQCIPAGLLRYCLRTGIVIVVSVPFWYLMFDCYLRLIWADRRDADQLRGLWRTLWEQSLLAMQATHFFLAAATCPL